MNEVRPAVKVKYKRIELIDIIQPAESFIHHFKEDISTQSFGQESEIYEKDSLLSLLLALDALYKIASETVLILNNSDKILLYDNQVKPVIRDESINIDFAYFSEEEYLDQRIGDLEINIDQIFSQSVGLTFYEKLKNALILIKNRIKGLNKLLLIGSEIKPLFLLTLIMSFGTVHKVFYKQSEKSEEIQIR